MNKNELKEKDIKIVRRRDNSGNFFYHASYSKIKNCLIYGNGTSPNEAIKDLYDNFHTVLFYTDKLGDYPN